MKKELFYTIILIIPILILLSFPAWPVPMTINYQGKLTDPNGNALNGEYQMNFSLFNTDTNGTTLWSEQQTIMVANGIYNVQLGSVNPLSASIFNNDALFLEVGIESDTLSPRQRLTSTPFAMKAGDAETVDGYHASNFVGTGQTESITSDMIVNGSTLSEILDDDGSGSGLDADLLDGKDSTEFLDTSTTMQTKTGGLNIEGYVGIGTTEPKNPLEVRIPTSTAQTQYYEPLGHVNFIARSNQLILTRYDDDVPPFSGSGIGIVFADEDTKENFGGISIGKEDFRHLYKDENGNAYSPPNDYFDFRSINGGFMFGIGDYNQKNGIPVNAFVPMIITNNGNVGIGTTQPTGKLHVYSSNLVGGLPTGAIITSGKTSGSSYNIAIGNTNIQARKGLDTVSALDLNFFGGDVLIRSGKVGIGTTDPGVYKLKVNGDVNIVGKIYLMIGGTNSWTIETYNTGAGGSAVYAVGSGSSGYGVMGIASETSSVNYGVYGKTLSPTNGFAGYFEGGKSYFSGNVGIGTVNPQGALDVNGTIFQRGSQLHADYVFESEYKLESIEEHSKYMWENKHLKAIPKAKAAEDGKEIVEVGAHRKGIVEELEKAHIYIEQLHKRITEMEGLIAKNEALEKLVNELSTRIEALETNN